MQKHHLITINALFFGSMLFVAVIVFQFLTGNKPFETLLSGFGQKTTTVTTTNCTDKPPLQSLASSTDTQIRKLAVYQDVCHSFVSSTLMVFTGMPVSDESARTSAKVIANTLKAMSSAGIRPLVIAEPSDDAGNIIDFSLLARGDYDAWFATYFAEIKAQGITDKQMGIWNPLPEANLPYWNNNLPEYFAPAVNRYVAAAKRYFPTMETSILLNSATYEATDFNWENGDYQSLLQYVKGITPGSINYVGLQGFPWVAPKGGLATIYNASEFLNHELLQEMADAMKVKNVWFNTGTFGTRYALDPARAVNVTPEQRKQILLTIETQLTEMKQKGYNVSVNIFAKNKSQQSEETDWSYWNGKPFESPSTPVFTEFANAIHKDGIDMWLFDD